MTVLKLRRALQLRVPAAPRRGGALLAALFVASLGCGDRSSLALIGGAGRISTYDASAGASSGTPLQNVMPVQGDSGDGAPDSGSVAASNEAGQSCALPDASSLDAGAEPPSCRPGGPGMTDCGPNHESCCASLQVTGGTFFRRYTYPQDGGALLPDGGPTGESDPATLSTFKLDKYLVTVGRFRQFVNAFNAGCATPAAGSGKHTHVNGGRGLSSGLGGFEPGWKASDDGNLSPTDGNLTCVSNLENSWTSLPGGQENLPIICVNWWEAYAFCIWDGAFLPSEAEWEYAAAGGVQQRAYPWGSADPGASNEYAIYDCHYELAPYSCDLAPVGTASLGAGAWGQLDLGGEVWEWLLDWFNGSFVDPCVDCTDLTPTVGFAGERTFLGGSIINNASELYPWARTHEQPSFRGAVGGFRCARSP